jgi:hypothetical protein
MTPRPALPTTRRRAAIVAALAAAVAWAAPALAGQTTIPGTCFASGQRVVVTGAGFTPGAPVAISGAAMGAAQADALGGFTTEFLAPTVRSLGPVRMMIVMTDGANPGNVTTVPLDVVRQAFASNLPLRGDPREMTTWRFAGFVPGRPIYGHFVLGDRSRGDHRFGMARGGCGTLSTRAERIPGVRDLRPGTWTLKLDQRRRYREGTAGSTHSFPVRAG